MKLKRSGQRIRAWGLIEMLVVVAIILIAAIVLLPRYMGGASKTITGDDSPVRAAKSVACRANLSQVRGAIQAQAVGSIEGERIQSLSDLKLPQDSLVCPVGGEQYVLETASSAVQCPHSGHEGY